MGQVQYIREDSDVYVFPPFQHPQRIRSWRFLGVFLESWLWTIAPLCHIKYADLCHHPAVNEIDAVVYVLYYLISMISSVCFHHSRSIPYFPQQRNNTRPLDLETNPIKSLTIYQSTVSKRRVGYCRNRSTAECRCGTIAGS